MKTLIILAVWVLASVVLCLVNSVLPCLFISQDRMKARYGCAIYLANLVAGFLLTVLLVKSGYLM